MSLVKKAIDRNIVTLTLNRPDKLNALSPGLFYELDAQLEALERGDDGARCVIINGAGRSFCAGADLEALKAGVVTPDPEFRSKTVERLGRLSLPVIVSVHGHCYTGGLELALAGDIIIAAEDARFCDTHAKLDIIPKWGLSARLPRRIGLAAAKRLSLTCRPMSGREALAIGLCDYCVPAETLNEATMDLARKIAGHSSRSIAGIKTLYEKAAQLPIEEALRYERDFKG